MKKRTYKQLKMDSEVSMSAAIGAIIGLIVMIIYFTYLDLQNQKDIPLDLGSVYYDGNGNAWVRFNLSDNRQIAIVKQIELICRENNIPNCMNSLDRLGVQR